MGFYTHQEVKSENVKSSYDYENFLKSLIKSGCKVIAPMYISDTRMGYDTDRAIVLVEVTKYLDTGPM